MTITLWFKAVAQKIDGIDFLKTFIFAPQPDKFLMEDNYLQGYFKWISGIQNAKYIDVIFGRYIARPVDDKQMNLYDKSTYYKVEKGTDINLAIHALTKAYNNAYDTAFVFSADTDYFPVYQQLKNMGKIVVLVCVKGQEFGKIKPEVDDFIVLDKDFFNRHIRK